MLRTTLLLVILAVFACSGGHESGQKAGEAEGAPGGAPSGAATTTKPAKPKAPSKPAARKLSPEDEATRVALADPLVQNCLALIRSEKYDEALPKCREAAKKFPENAEVQAAIEMAQLGGLGPEFEGAGK